MNLTELKKTLTTATKSDVEILVGKKKTGKTSYLIDQVINETHHDKVIFVNPKVIKKEHQIFTTKKNKKIDIWLLNPDSQTFKDILNQKAIQKLLLILDDAKEYFPANPNQQQAKDLISLLTVSRHKEASVYLVYHLFRDINPRIFAHSDRMTIFKTAEDLTEIKKQLPNYQDIKKAVDYVNSLKSDYKNKTISV